MMRAYWNHFWLNVGSVLCSAFHAILPPQVDHTAEEVERLRQGSAWSLFLYGAGLRDNP